MGSSPRCWALAPAVAAVGSGTRRGGFGVNGWRVPNVGEMQDSCTQSHGPCRACEEQQQQRRQQEQEHSTAQQLLRIDAALRALRTAAATHCSGDSGGGSLL